MKVLFGLQCVEIGRAGCTLRFGPCQECPAGLEGFRGGPDM